MANIKEKVAYLQGLTKGLKVKDQSAEGKLLVNIVDVLYDMADEVQCLHSDQQDLENYVESVDEDLAELEENVYEDSDDLDLMEVECPSCNEHIAFDASDLEEGDAVEVTCPNCGEVIYEESVVFAGNDYDQSFIRHAGHPGI